VKGENWIGQKRSEYLKALPLPNQRLNQTQKITVNTELAIKLS
jgi:hypothetical protein